MEEEEILTTPKVAKLLGVTVASINEWLKAGHFPNAYRINPMRPRSAWRIPKRDIDEFIEKRRKLRGFIYLPPQVVTPEPQSAIEPDENLVPI